MAKIATRVLHLPSAFVMTRLMADAFEQWAPIEIRRLREEADTLERALDRFVNAQGRRSKSPVYPSASESHGRRSKYEPLFMRWAEMSRERPITLDDMDRIAREAGTTMTRNLLRTTVFAQKRAGRVRVQADGYVWMLPKIETAPPVQEDAVL